MRNFQACNQNSSSISFEPSFDNWDQQQFFNTALSLKSTSFEDDSGSKDDDLNNDPFTTSDPFADAQANNTSGFDAIIGNNNISSNQLMYGYHNGIYDQANDFLMNFYASQCTNYPFTATTNTPSYNNPFHPHHFINHHATNDIIDDINSNNDNWANFNSSPDNFADFDSHFANMEPMGVESTTTTTNQFAALSVEEKKIDTNEEEVISQDQPKEELQQFIATTQVIEISALPPSLPVADEEPPREFQLGPSPTHTAGTKQVDELDDEEFYSLRDDSNEVNSLTDDTDRKLGNENTEIPDDDDDDFASADERYIFKALSECQSNEKNHSIFVVQARETQRKKRTATAEINLWTVFLRDRTR